MAARSNRTRWWVAALAGAAAAVGGVGMARRVDRRVRPAPFAPPAELRFPPGFRFGAGTSAYQVEGGISDNNWTRWARTAGRDGVAASTDGQLAERASDHWARFPSDLELMRDLGIDLYRFSLEWSRIEPAPGRFDAAVLERYRSWCEQLQAAGITPIVTLHHFTEPAWLTEQGGFGNADAVDAFGRFVEHVVPALADVCDWWITINEPAFNAASGWLLGEWPPGQREARAAQAALGNLLAAHARAYHIIHRLDTADADGDGVACRAALAKHVFAVRPRRGWNPGDRLAARLTHHAFNHAVLEACRTGRLQVLPRRRARVIKGLAGTLDFVGVTHYFRLLASLDPRAPAGVRLGFDEHSDKNDLGWDLLGWTLGEAVRFAAGYGKPVVVTGHGTCDSEQPDRRRAAFLLDSLHALSDAVSDGVDVRGYVHWSLLDGLEWAHGFRPRFGLHRVDYDTQERTLTGGGALYRDVIAAHRARHGG